MIPPIHMSITLLIKMMLISLIFSMIGSVGAYRIKGDADETKHFVPYEVGNVGNVHQFTTAQKWSNQGYTDSIVLGDSVGKNRLTACPKMIGPINDEYFCSDIEKGYCDRRSGTCFCNDGYMGDACDDCAPTHVKRGGVCYPKTPCPNNCSRFGECNFQTGICECSEFREGADCSQPKCSRYHEFCKTCDEDGCIECEGGYSSHKTAEWGEQCQPCWRFDPRCRTCSEEACTSCVDLLLLSIHRSGRRPHDPPLPVDELMRELSVTVPFGSTQEDAFYDAEHYFLVDSSMAPLNESAVECHQGLNNDPSISCTPYNLTSHIICGNHGTITFDSPEYAVREDENHVRLTLRRSGGGVDEVRVSYSVYPITAGYEDVSSTAYYTTNRTIVFRPGQITASFLVTINDDRIMEPDEIFSVHLSNPTGGASLGTQQRTIVTIIDDDADRICSHAVESDLSTTVQQPNIGVAGDLFEFSLFSNTCAGSASTEGGGDMFKVVVRKHAIEDSHYTVDATGSCEHALENAYYCSMNATASGDYKLDVYHLIPGGLRGYYFTDSFLDDSRLDMVRIDASLNFTWGTGPVTRFARDYLSVRWEGYVRPMHSETYSFWLDVDDHTRLWIDGNLLIDWWTFPAAPSSMLHAEYNFTALETYEIVLEYRDILGNATSRLLWSSDSTPITAVPSSSLYYREPIRGSPFDCVILPAATDASQSRAFGEDVHYAIAGQQHTFTVIPNDVFGNFRGWPLHSLTNDERHLEVFHVTAQMLDNDEGEAGASINFDVSYDESSRNFYMSYNPISSGFYRLNVTYGNSVHISGSPFSLHVVPGITFAQESIAFGSGLEFGMAGELSTATIQSFDANRNKKVTGGDDWKVTLTSVITDEYEYGRVEDHNNGTYTLQIVPSVAGPNDLSITLNGSPIRGSSFRMNVVHNEVDGSSSFIVNKADVSTMIAMREATIIIQAADSWGNMAVYCNAEPYNTSIIVQSDSIDDASTSVRYIGGGKYEITVMPVISGEEINLEILVNEEDIVDSPLVVAVKPGKFSSNTSVATGTGLRIAEAGVESFFFIESKDEGGNNKVLDEAIFNVTLTLVERAGIPAGIESQTVNATDEVVVRGSQLFTHGGRYAIQYTCFVAGMYDLYISDDKGNSVVGSPFRVEVVPSQLSGKHSIVLGEGTIHGVAGKVAPVKLFPRDRYGNFIYDSQETVEYELSLQSRHKSMWEDDIEQTQRQLARASGDGSFTLDYVTKHAGHHTFDITTFLPGGLKASYFSSPDFSPDYLVLSSIEDNVDTNWTTLSYSYACVEDDHVCASEVIGPYHVAAKWSGKLKADVNEEYTIRVECNDGGQTKFAIADLHVPWKSCWPYAETRITLPTNAVDILLKYKNYDGVNPFVFLKWSSSTSEGMETIPSSRLLYHQIVGNTTFYSTIVPDSVYAPNSIAMGDSLRHAVSGIEHEFLVECRDRHGNLLLDGETISVVSSGYNANATIEATVFDHKNGTFSVRYTPVLSGEYLLSVQIGELGSSRSHIKDSPFRLTVLPGESDPTESILVLNDDGKGIAGNRLISSLHTFDRHGNRREKGGDNVIVYLSKVFDEKYQYECGVDDDNTGIYIIDCPAQWEATNYHLDVSLVNSNGVAEPIESSPFNVTVLPGDAFAATASITSGGTPITNQNNVPSVHFTTNAGSWSSFVLTTKDMFGNYLQQGGNHFVTQTDGNSSVTEVQVVDQGNGGYIVAYKVDKSSTHKFEISMVAGNGLLANYYQIDDNGSPIESMIDEQIDYNSWRLENSVPFSRVTWIGYISFPHAGQFELELAGVEGQCRLYIGDTAVVDTCVGGSIGSFDAMDNVLYAVEVEYSLNVDRLLLKLFWSSTKLPQQIVPSNHLFHSSEPIHGSPFSLTVV